MEIHAPHQPILTLKEFMVHLLVVTAGILIALGLEQSVEMFHHHSLAQEAKANMLTEIGDNKKELDNHLGEFGKMEKDREDGVGVIGQLLAHKHLKSIQIGLSFSGPTLSSTSWTTASTVGALVYMDYGEVKQFAEIYKLQAFYDQMQNDEIRNVQVGYGLLSNLKEGPNKVTDDELRSIKHQLQQSAASVSVVDQVGRQLSAAYGKLLHK